MRLNRINRQSKIESCIIKEGSMTLADLADKFNLSVNTIRRDVIDIEKRGRISRIHGGVIANEIIEEPTNNSIINYSKEKEFIGYTAASIIEDNQSIYIDAGTTAATIVKHLGNKNITIITSSVNALMEATNLPPNIVVIVLGGEYIQSSGALHSFSSFEDLKNFNIDIAFVGATGIGIETGLTTVSFMEYKIKSSVIQHARKNVIVADSTKFGVRSVLKFGELCDADILVTDKTPSQEMIEFCKSNQIQILSYE